LIGKSNEHPATDGSVVQVDIIKVAVGTLCDLNHNAGPGRKHVDARDVAVGVQADVTNDSLAKIVEEDVAVVLRRVQAAV